jgi:hypothetical protein
MYLSHHGSVRGATPYSSFVEKQWAKNTSLVEKQKVKPHTRWIINGSLSLKCKTAFSKSCILTCHF